MSYTINVTRSTNLLDRFHAAYEVCEKNVKKLRCSLRWENSFNSLDRKDKSRTTAAICYGQDRNLSRSEVALTLHISQLVTRSLSVMILSPSTGGISKPRWLIRVDVLCKWWKFCQFWLSELNNLRDRILTHLLLLQEEEKDILLASITHHTSILVFSQSY